MSIASPKTVLELNLSETIVVSPIIDRSKNADSITVRKKQWQDHFRETPSWLTSFVIHFLCFLTFLSITTDKKSATGEGAILLTMDTAGESSETSSIMEVSVPQSMSDEGETDLIPAKVFQRTEEFPQPVEHPKTMSHDSNESAEGSTDEGQEATSSPNYKYAALTMRQRLRSTGAGRPSALLAANPISQSAFDKVVDRFILYDIGDLRGAEGAKAVREFRELGPSAVPALVRGLNKSANIHASCPVGVIASKLMSALSTASDPALTKYAVDHIGEGVSSFAPHFRRITAFRDNWITKASDLPHEVSKMLADRGLEGEGGTLEIALSLTDASVTELLIAVESKDDDLSVPAMVALLKRIKGFSKADQFRARTALDKKVQNGGSDDSKKLIKECNSRLGRANRSVEPSNNSPFNIAF